LDGILSKGRLGKGNQKRTAFGKSSAEGGGRGNKEKKKEARVESGGGKTGRKKRGGT